MYSEEGCDIYAVFKNQREKALRIGIKQHG